MFQIKETFQGQKWVQHHAAETDVGASPLIGNKRQLVLIGRELKIVAAARLVIDRSLTALFIAAALSTA